MASLDDRFFALLVGGLVGFVLGYLTCWVRVANEKLKAMDKVLDEVHRKVQDHTHDERGIMTTRAGMNTALAVVVALTVFASFQSQRAVNAYKDSQRREAALTSCTASILKETITALDVRSNFTRKQAAANVELQRAQSELVAVLLHQPPYTNQRQTAAFKKYFTALNRFVNAFDKAEDTADNQPYPSIQEFNACIVKAYAEGG